MAINSIKIDGQTPSVDNAAGIVDGVVETAPIVVTAGEASLLVTGKNVGGASIKLMKEMKSTDYRPFPRANNTDNGINGVISRGITVTAGNYKLQISNIDTSTQYDFEAEITTP